MAVPAGPRLSRPLLLVAALDSLLLGLWAVARPADLFRLLGVALPENPVSLWSVNLGVLSRQAMFAPGVHDAYLLWQLLGVLTLGHCALLLWAAARPGERAGLALVPLLGRSLQAGLWLWLLGTDRVRLPAGPLTFLLAQDLLIVALLAGLLFLAGRGTKAR